MERVTLRADVGEIQDAEALENIELATLTLYDIPALAALSIAAYSEEPIAENLWESTEQIRMTFEGAFGAPRDDSMIGAWANGELVGAIFGVLDPPWDDTPRGPFVLELMVAPEHRRRGIASALISELARRVETWGYDSLTINLDMRKTPGALNLYSGFGFEPVES